MDLIDRRAAIDAIERAKTAKTEGGEVYVAKYNAEMNIALLPSAQPEHTSNNDCNGCKFVGCYDTDFPCANCIRKNKDYYDPERRTDVNVIT